MSVVAFVNNRAGWQALRRLRAAGERIAAVFVHDAGRRRYGPEILREARRAGARVFLPSSLRDGRAARALERLAPAWGVSAFYGEYLPVGVRSAFSRGCINVHPSYLPFNRGAYPNVWPLVERTPAGASIHGMDDGIDTGPVYARRRVRVAPWDTGKTLYAKTEEACVRLFADKWPAIRSGRLRPRPQPRRGTAHRTADVRRIDEIDLRRRYVAADLIDVLRARTFPPHAGAFFRAAGKRVYLRLELIPEPGGKR